MAVLAGDLAKAGPREVASAQYFSAPLASVRVANNIELQLTLNASRHYED
jgi:hypothetical protein